MSLHEILRSYHDSEVDGIFNVQDTVEVELVLKQQSVSKGVHYVVSTEVGGENCGDISSFGSKELLYAINKKVANFFVDDRYSYLSDNLCFKTEVRFNDSSTILRGSGVNLTKILAFCLDDRKNLVEPSLKVSLTVTRFSDECDKKLRQKMKKAVTKDRTTKEYFGTFLNPTCNSSGQNDTHSAKKHSFAYGTLKYLIMNQRNATLRSFLYEYLYGIKVAKSCNTVTLFLSLAARPYNDFGILDAKKLRDLETIIRSYYSNSIHYLSTELKKVGIEPASKLDRWQTKTK